MKKLLAGTMLGTLLLSVSCGMGDTASTSLNNAKTSAYSTMDNTYVPGTYSANRVKYYDGLYNDNYTTNTTDYTTNGYKDVRNTTDANYLKNSYVNNSTMYDNNMYKDLSATDFNNGLVTYDHNTDTTTSPIDTTKVATNALNYKGGASTTMMSGVYDNGRNIDTVTIDGTKSTVTKATNNNVNYEVGNTYNEMKTATKDLVNDVATDAKVAVNKAKIETQKTVNDMQY